MLVYCHCVWSDVVPAEVKQSVLDRLLASAVPFEAVPDLCQMAAAGDPALARYAAAEDLRIAACYPRTVEGLFAAAGLPLDPQRCRIANLRTQSAADAAELLLEPAAREDAC